MPTICCLRKRGVDSTVKMSSKLNMFRKWLIKHKNELVIFSTVLVVLGYYVFGWSSAQNDKLHLCFVKVDKFEYNLTQENETFRKNLETVTINRSEPAYEILEDAKILPASARVRAKKIFKNKPLVIWATEWHMTPIKDLTNTLSPFGVKVLNYNLDQSRCLWQDCTIKSKLKVLNSDNAIEANSTLIKSFVEAYKDDEEMKTVDVVFCGHPVSLCELYMQLNKSVLVLASTRYDCGRFTAERWNELNNNLIKLSKLPWNVIGGNNLYDAKFLQYYTGIKPYHVPNMCDYTSAEYTNQLDRYLVIRRYDRDFDPHFFGNFDCACKLVNCTAKLDMISKLRYTYESLAKYRAAINVPYQVSVMTIFELYRMNVPMFFPSTELLATWQVNYYIMRDRSFDGSLFGRRPKASIIPPHPSQKRIPDPKNEYDYNSTVYWMHFCDFYQVFPHGIIYESIPHLVYLLESIDDGKLWEISRKMQRYNVEFKKALLNKWRDILLRYARHSPNSPS